MSRWLLAGVAAMLVALSAFSAQDQASSSLLEELVVPNNPSRVQSRMVLEAGRQYVLEASGTFSDSGNAAPGLDAVWCFAEYRCGSQGQIWNSLRIDGRGMTDIAGYPVPYNPMHVYRISYSGQGRPAEFYLSGANGNYGGITVHIYGSAGGVAVAPRAQPGTSNFEGAPTQLHEAAMVSYWIWHDSDGYHLRTTTAHDRRVFHGRIEFSREPAWARAYQLRPDDYVRLIGQSIEFHLATERNLNGFDFRIDYPNEATFNLEVDDHKGSWVTEHTFLGRDNAHPLSSPFTASP